MSFRVFLLLSPVRIVSSSVIKCLEKSFTFTGTPSYIHTNNAAFFASREFKQYFVPVQT